jgi:hypothetical protein
VDGDGRLYDTFYRRCEQSEAARLVQRLARLPFPSPDTEGTYIDFNSYEAAVLEWKKQVTTALGHLTLPQLMGRAYPRPRVFKMVCLAAAAAAAAAAVSFSDHDAPHRSTARALFSVLTTRGWLWCDRDDAYGRRRSSTWMTR